MSFERRQIPNSKNPERPIDLSMAPEYGPLHVHIAEHVDDSTTELKRINMPLNKMLAENKAVNEQAAIEAAPGGEKAWHQGIADHGEALEIVRDATLNRTRQDFELAG